MTLVTSWITREGRKLSSAYIVSDSKISWGKNDHYDYARKVFACSKYPEIFAYCGDVIYPSIVLNQIVEMIDNHVLFLKKANRFERSDKIYEKLKEKFSSFPNQHMCGVLKILHISRDDKEEFLIKIYEWNKTKNWKSNIHEIPINNESETLITMGSGSNEFNRIHRKYKERLKETNGLTTSRGIFQCFCRALTNFEINNDPFCGGAPQLVGLYNNNIGKYFGIIYNDKRYFLGSEMKDENCLASIKWHNENFEVCNGKTKEVSKREKKRSNELDF